MILLNRSYVFGLIGTLAIAAAACSSTTGNEEVSVAAQVDDPAEQSSTSPPNATVVETVTLGPEGGQACSGEGLCVDLSGSGSEYDFTISDDGEVMRRSKTHACFLAGTRRATTFSSGTSDDQYVYTGTVPLNAPVVDIPGVSISQLRVSFGDHALQVFTASSAGDLSDRIIETFNVYATGLDQSFPECENLPSGSWSSRGGPSEGGGESS